MMVQLEFEQEAFKGLLEQYLSQTAEHDNLQKVRGRAWDHFLELGLPTKQTEVYRYIKLRQLFGQNFSFPTDFSSNEIDSSILPECQGAVLTFVNGLFSKELSQTEQLPSKVIILDLVEAYKTYSSFLNNYWTKALKEETDPFVALNSAMSKKGLFLYVPPKTIVEKPIQILHIVTQDNVFINPKSTVFVGAQSQIKLVVTQKLINTTKGFNNSLTEFVLEEDAHVHYSQNLCNESLTAWHFDALRASLKRNATLKTVSVTEGSATVRNDYKISLTGENAEALLNAVWMLSEKREAHYNVFIDHQAPNCRSYQLFKGVLNEFSKSSFEGKIMVRQAAQKTEAFQLNNNLLLSDHAHADSKPNLEIFADDVKASHGATVGQLDEDQLFYMKTRGFPAEKAKNLLVYGFCEQVIELIGVESLKNKISHRAHRYL